MLKFFLRNQLCKSSKEETDGSQLNIHSRLGEFTLMQSKMSSTGFSGSKNFQSFELFQMTAKDTQVRINQARLDQKKR